MDPRCRALPRPRSRRLADHPRRGDPRVGAALSAARKLVLRPGDRVGAGAPAAAGALRRTARRNVHRRLPDPQQGRSRRPGRPRRAGCPHGAARRPSGSRRDRLRGRDHLTRPAAREAVHLVAAAGARRQPAGARHRAAGRPGRSRPDLLQRPPSRRGDRDPADAARPARRLRRLDRGRDPVSRRRLHDRRDARAALPDRPRRVDGRLRPQPRRADRAGARGRLLAPRRAPLPGGAAAGRGSGRRGRAHDRHSRPGGRVLRRRRRNRARSPARRAGAVHPLDGDRRPSDPRRLRRSRAHPAAGASLMLRREARRPRARRRLLGPHGTNDHAAAARVPRRRQSRAGRPGAPRRIARAHAGIADGDPWRRPSPFAATTRCGTPWAAGS